MIQYFIPSPLLALLLMAALTWGAYRRRVPMLFVRCRHLLAALTAWGWLCCTPGVVNVLLVGLEGPLPADTPEVRVQRDPATTIVVLGSGEMWSSAGIPAPRLDEHGWERMYGGVELWRRTGGRLIFTGGPGGAGQQSLAGLMGRLAAELGVPREDIDLAGGSRTTYEDLRVAQQIIQQRGGGPVWLVTSAMHMPRSLAVARQLGMDARPFPVDHRQIRRVTWRAWLPANSFERVADVLHEIAGRLYYRLRGRSV